MLGYETCQAFSIIYIYFIGFCTGHFYPYPSMHVSDPVGY